MKTRSEIKSEAKQILSANYGAILGEMILVAILTGLGGIVVGIGSLIVGPPLMVGFCEGIRLLWQGKKKDKLFTGFEGDLFGRSVTSMLWMLLFLILWMLLFIIPLYIKAFAYSMTPFIVSDSKNITGKQALQLSMKITRGYKGKLFVFCLSYIGWFLLNFFTAGLLGIFYIGPYMATALGGYYLELKKKALEDGVVTMADFGYPEGEPTE